MQSITLSSALQNFSNDRTIKSKTVNDSKIFRPQSLATQVKKGEELVSMIPAFKKAFDLMGDGIKLFSTENEFFFEKKNKISSFDEKRLEDSKAKLLKEFKDEKIANLIMSEKSK